MKSVTGIQQIILLCGLLCCVYSATSQTNVLDPELEGYTNCGASDNVQKCLEYTLASIDSDEGYYSSMEHTKRSGIKVEYCIQLALLHSINNRLAIVSNYYQIAKETLQKELLLDPDNEHFNALNDKLNQKIAAFCAQNQEGDYAICATSGDEEVNTPPTVSTTVVLSEPEPVKVAQTPLEEFNTTMVQTLTSYMKSHPLNKDFTRSGAADSCVLQIRRSEGLNTKVLDCLLAHSNYVDEVGFGLMGIAKAIKYNETLQFESIDLTILVKPSTEDRIILENGKFYIYYNANPVVSGL